MSSKDEILEIFIADYKESSTALNKYVDSLYPINTCVILDGNAELYGQVWRPGPTRSPGEVLVCLLGGAFADYFQVSRLQRTAEGQ